MKSTCSVDWAVKAYFSSKNTNIFLDFTLLLSSTFRKRREKWTPFVFVKNKTNYRFRFLLKEMHHLIIQQLTSLEIVISHTHKKNSIHFFFNKNDNITNGFGKFFNLMHIYISQLWDKELLFLYSLNKIFKFKSINKSYVFLHFFN